MANFHTELEVSCVSQEFLQTYLSGVVINHVSDSFNVSSEVISELVHMRKLIKYQESSIISPIKIFIFEVEVVYESELTSCLLSTKVGSFH